MKKIMARTALAIFSLLFWASSAIAVEFGVFGDVSLNESTLVDSKSAFTLGAVDFFAVADLNENTRAFVELVFEQSDGGLVTDLERLWIRRSVSDEFVIAAGRFHTPLGYWNRSYHHGSLLQDTISRPFFLDFEDGASGVLPVHIVGLMFTGEFYHANAKVRYEAAIANGPSINSSGGFGAINGKPEIDINAATDANNNKSPVFRITYKTNKRPLELSVFAMRNIIAESGTSTTVGAVKGGDLVAQTIIGTDINYRGSIELHAEIYQIKNSDQVVGPSGNKIRHTATAWYLQLAYPVKPNTKLVYRHSALDFDNDDVYFSLLGTRNGKRDLMGVRYDLDEINTVKLEIARIDTEASTEYNTFTLQWAFLVP